MTHLERKINKIFYSFAKKHRLWDSTYDTLIHTSDIEHNESLLDRLNISYVIRIEYGEYDVIRFITNKFKIVVEIDNAE